jgi:hypothetical protein
MLNEDWLKVIQADREREIEAAGRAHAVRAAAPRTGRVRAWFNGRFAAGPAPSAGRPQAGRAVTDPSA